MRVTPVDIAHKTFGRKVYGLDNDEVYEFLRDLADEFEDAQKTIKQQTLKIQGQEKTLRDFQEREESLKKTLHTASQMSDRIRAEAEKEGDLIVRDARQRADLIIKEARDSLRSMYQEINDLKKSRMQFETGLKSLVKAHLAMVEQGYTAVPDPQLRVSPNLGQNMNQTFAEGAPQGSADGSIQGSIQGGTPGGNGLAPASGAAAGSEATHGTTEVSPGSTHS